MSNPIGTIYDNALPVIIIPDGSRGARGLPGADGDPGPDGSSINVIGPWANGQTYAPLDGVTGRSSATQGAQSLFVQKSDQPSSPSTTEPYLDPSRWSEVGATSVESSFGSLWTVQQVGHPFSKVGQPAALTASGYVLASASSEATAGIALVREVVDASTFILQSTGGLPNVDDTTFLTGTPTSGDLLYVSTTAGFLTTVAPTAAGQITNPIFKADGPDSGAVLPWRPVENTTITIGVATTLSKFYYTATGGQTAFTGPDNNGQTPDYTNSQVDVFQNGLNLIETVDFTFTATTVTLTNPATLNDTIEIWAREVGQIVPVSRLKLDGLTFDGVTTDFDITAGATPISFAGAASFDIYLDGNPQEPTVDFTTVDNGGDTRLVFTVAPEADTEFWGLTYAS